jgi:hypothetical protein
MNIIKPGKHYFEGLMKDVKAKKINLPTSVTYRGNFRILRRMVMPNFDFQMSTIVEIKKRFNWMVSFSFTILIILSNQIL